MTEVKEAIGNQLISWGTGCDTGCDPMLKEIGAPGQISSTDNIAKIMEEKELPYFSHHKTHFSPTKQGGVESLCILWSEENRLHFPVFFS